MPDVLKRLLYLVGRTIALLLWRAQSPPGPGVREHATRTRRLPGAACCSRRSGTSMVTSDRFCLLRRRLRIDSTRKCRCDENSRQLQGVRCSVLVACSRTPGPGRAIARPPGAARSCGRPDTGAVSAHRALCHHVNGRRPKRPRSRRRRRLGHITRRKRREGRRLAPPSLVIVCFRAARSALPLPPRPKGYFFLPFFLSFLLFLLFFAMQITPLHDPCLSTKC